jgi:hypothetical protein
MTLLSIVVPIREMGGKLAPLFDWVNTALNIGCEVVLVHDFADSQTEFELSTFVGQHSTANLVFLSASFNSPGLARNEGLARISGDYVAFWDSDDLPDVRKVSDLAQDCKDADFEIGIGGFLTLDEAQRTISLYPTSLQHCLPKVAMYPGLWRMVFKSSILKDIKFTSLLLAEDQIFLARLHPTERKILFSDQIVYGYTVKRIGALTSRRVNTPDLIKAVEYLTGFLAEKTYKPDFVFNLTLAIKNCLTILKIGTNRQRIQTCKILCQIFFRYLPDAICITFSILKFKKKEIKK